MQKIVGVIEFQRHFRLFFEDVVRKHTPLILTRRSCPEAVLIPSKDYLSFQQMQEIETLAQFDRVWNRLAEVNVKYCDKEIATDIESALSL